MDSGGCKNKETLINNLEITASITKCSDANLRNVHKKIITVFLELRYPPGSSKELYIQVTEEADPLVLLTSVLTESGYQALYSSQGLLIDFSSFPHHLESHIKQCSSGLIKDDPKEVLVLRVTSDVSPPVLSKIDTREKAFLEVVQVGIIRHFCLFSIGISPASDEDKLSHISSSIKDLKKSLSIERRDARDRETNLSSEIDHLRDIVIKKDADILALKNELDQQKIFISKQEENFHIKEDEIKGKMGSECDKKLKCQEMEHRRQLKNLRSNIDHLNKDKQALYNERNALKESHRELEFNSKKNHEKIQQQSDQLSNLHSSNRNLKQEIQEEKKYANRLNAKMGRLQANYNSIEKEFEKVNELKHELEEREARLKSDLESIEIRLNEESSKHKEVSVELKQALRFISKFKKQIEDLKSEAKEKGTTLEKFKNALSERDSCINRMEAFTKDLEKELEEEKGLLDSYRKQLEEAKRNISEQEENIESNQSLISLLKKRLSEAEMTEAIIRKAPLSEGYLPPSNRNIQHLSGNPAGLTTSTPLSGAPAPHPNFGAIKGEDRYINNISRIPEEDTRVPQGDFLHEDENIPVDLEKKYLEPSRKNLPSRGLLRSNHFPPKPNEEKAPAGLPSKVQSRGRGTAFHKRGVKTKGPQSNYFPKRNP